MVYRSGYLRIDCLRFLLWFCLITIFLLSRRPYLIHNLLLLALELTGGAILSGVLVYLQL
ncbi:MAG: hypothetical protein Kow00121_14540 [Elainellaceae cyanobacterium]